MFIEKNQAFEPRTSNNREAQPKSDFPSRVKYMGDWNSDKCQRTFEGTAATRFCEIQAGRTE
jgi:hypothetical protein